MVLLREIERGDAERDSIERVRTQLVPTAGLPKFSRIRQKGEFKAESQPGLLFPLPQKWAGGRNDQNSMRAPPRYEFGRDQTCLNGFAQSNTVRQQQPGPRHIERSE